MNYFNLKALVV